MLAPSGNSSPVVRVTGHLPLEVCSEAFSDCSNCVEDNFFWRPWLLRGLVCPKERISGLHLRADRTTSSPAGHVSRLCVEPCPEEPLATVSARAVTLSSGKSPAQWPHRRIVTGCSERRFRKRDIVEKSQFAVATNNAKDASRV